MKTLKYIYTLIMLFVMGSLLLTCTEGNDDKPAVTDNEVTFSINVSNLKSSSMLKSSMDENLSDAKKIILTIQNSDGTPTKYTSYAVEIQQMNGIYFTQKLLLKPGNYKLTEFSVLDANDSTIFVTPLTGSQESQNISNPLPIAFSVAKDNTTHIVVEVLSTKNKKPQDFGLTHFSIIEVKTFSFVMGVADRSISKVLPVKLTVSNGAYSYVQNLDSVLNNVVTIKDGLSNYTMKIEKVGYKTYSYTYSLDSLKMFAGSIGKSPLLVELEKVDLKAVIDCDGNVYHSVTIGTQVWMTENLKTTKYNDCTEIPLVTDGTWSNLKTPAYCWYNNNEAAYKNPYGALYNWYTVNTGKLCPSGWHVPSNNEWTTLINYLGGWNVAAGKLKESGTAHWSYNDGATNETGFTALPGGSQPASTSSGMYGFWWTTTVNHYVYDYMVGDIDDDAKYIVMDQGSAMSLYQPDYFGRMYKGFSVRCVKD